MYALTQPRKLFYTMKTIYIIVIRDNLSSEETYNETPGWSAQRRGRNGRECPYTFVISERLDRYLDKVETDTGLTTHRGAILRHALKVFWSQKRCDPAPSVP